MSATRFCSWFRQSWLDKKELLAPRHRVDCDPFLDVVGIMEASKKQLREEAATAVCADDVDTETATSPMITEQDLKTILADIISTTGSDQFMVCVGIIISDKVYTHQLDSVE